MESEIVVRKVVPADFPGLVQLYKEVWPDVTYDKQDKANFVLNESQGVNYCAEKDGQIVGSRTSFFVNFYHGGRAINCVQIGDSCTREDCRGIGLFSKMNRAFLADFFSPVVNGELIWNISVYASKKAYQKLGWNYIRSLQSILSINSPLRIFCHVGFDFHSLSGDVEWDSRNDEFTIDDRLLSAREKSMHDANVLHVKYDQPTLAWRMKTRSGIKCYTDTRYGAVVYKIGERKGLKYVLLGEAFPQEYTLKCLRNLLRAFKKSVKPDVIKSAIAIGHPLYPFYQKLGYRALRFLHHGVRVESEEMKNLCFEPSNWAISMLDVDTF